MNPNRNRRRRVRQAFRAWRAAQQELRRAEDALHFRAGHFPAEAPALWDAWERASQRVCDLDPRVG